MKSPQNRKKNLKPKYSVSEPSAQELKALMTVVCEGQYEQAVLLAQSLAMRFPMNVVGWQVLGNMLNEVGRKEEALLSMKMVVILKPDDADANSELALKLNDAGHLEEAEDRCRRALELNPKLVNAHNNLGNILIKLKRWDEAEPICLQALALSPDNANAHCTLGSVYFNMGRLVEAEASLLKALHYDPEHCRSYNLLGTKVGNLGRSNSDYFKKALALDPDEASIYSNLLFDLSMSALLDAPALFAEHLNYAQYYEAPLIEHWQEHRNSKVPHRKLQIGFVSGDFCNHAIASFIEPLLIHLTKVSSLSLHAYSNNGFQDATTQILKGYFQSWTPVSGLSNDELADKIRANSIDILIDLSGHTGLNRLLTFARKPAPIQVSWIGYPGTTGLKAMDYYIADKFFLPQDPFKDQFTEKLVYLPGNAPFIPHKDAPDVNALPALTNGYITFGSFNRLNKFNQGIIAVWSKLLLDLPTSRLIMAGMPESGYESLITWFAEQGISEERLSFYPRSSMAEYLALHNQVDICLDTFPYNGGTTNCHAIWMGVPTLTIAGQTPASRSGATLLSHLNLENLIAENADDFVNKGLGLANDIAHLAQIRGELRTRFSLSAFGQPEIIAKGSVHAFRFMWQRWCDDLPPISFDVSNVQIDSETSRYKS